MEYGADDRRHAREGGHPRHQLAWVPACAGMTTVLVLAGTGVAHAHTGLEHAFSFGAGFRHPWSGLDHLLAMLAVGLWAGLVGGRALRAWPVAFVAVMVLGGAFGMAGLALPLVESGILASVVVLGLLVLAAIRLPVASGAAVLAAFALLHGHAHGAELPADAAAATYAAGFAIATALLHALGIGIAHAAGSANGRVLVRAAGAAVAAAGVALAIV